jgi:hypothetical protein
MSCAVGQLMSHHLLLNYICLVRLFIYYALSAECQRDMLRLNHSTTSVTSCPKQRSPALITFVHIKVRLETSPYDPRIFRAYLPSDSWDLESVLLSSIGSSVPFSHRGLQCLKE